MKTWAEKELSREEAIAFAESGVWKQWTDEQIVRFQLFQMRLCMNFTRFHQAVESVLGRTVDTYEFGKYYDNLVNEYLGGKSMPTVAEIYEMIPAEKRMIFRMEAEMAA